MRDIAVRSARIDCNSPVLCQPGAGGGLAETMLQYIVRRLKKQNVDTSPAARKAFSCFPKSARKFLREYR